MNAPRTWRRTALLAAVLSTLTGLGVGAAVSKTSLSAPVLSSKPAAATQTRTATFAFTGPAGATFKCGLDGAATVPCTSPRTYSALADGTHVFNVVAVKGSDTSDVTSYQWVVDTVAPARPTITSTPSDPSGSSTASFAFAGPEAGLSYACSLDDGAFTACSSPTTYSGLGQGNHSFAVRAADAAGNTGTAETRSWKVDTVAPPAPVLAQKPTYPTLNATNDFAWTDAESGVTFQCAVENGSWQDCSSPYRWAIRTDNYGQHQFAVRARDAAGNYSSATTYVFKYEKGLPTSGVPFQMSGSISSLLIGVWQPIAVKVTNPNSVPIIVSAVQVSVSADSTPSGCSSAANIELQQSDVSASKTFTVPANGTVTLPAGGVSAPRIRLKNLPNVNQDVCKGKSFTLSYTGTATN